jgi:hypothetical protein
LPAAFDLDGTSCRVSLCRTRFRSQLKRRSVGGHTWRRRIMRYRAVLFATLGLAACSRAPVTRNESQAGTPTRDSAVRFLLTAAATDFHTHRPPDPVRFRDVRIGHVVTATGEKQYMLCGQFLPAQEGGKAEWTPFATIKTSGLRTMAWGSSCRVLPRLIGHMGPDGRLGLLAAEPARFSAIGYRKMLPPNTRPKLAQIR